MYKLKINRKSESTRQIESTQIFFKTLSPKLWTHIKNDLESGADWITLTTVEGELIE